MRIRIIGVPSAWGTNALGAQHTPRMLRQAGLLDWFSAAGHEVADGGDVVVVPMTQDDIQPGDLEQAPSDARSTDPVQLSRVAEMARGVRAAVSSSLEAGYLPLIVGGECSLGIGVVPALERHQGPVTVAWLDAHADLNTPTTSLSGLVTGMPLAAILGHGYQELTAIGADVARPVGEAAFLLGGRDLDAGEVQNAVAFGIRHLDTEASRAAGPEEVIMEILGMPEISIMPPEARAQIVAVDSTAAEAAANAPAPSVYLHFDVDVLDPAYAPGVDFPVAGGFDPGEVATLAGYLCASGCVGAIAVASANLERDFEERTVAAVREVLSSVADALAAL